MGKTIIHEFDPVIYPVKLWIVKNPTEETVHEQFEESDGKRLNYDFKESALASTYSKVISHKKSDKYGVLISIHTNIQIRHIAHESAHAARFIWDWLGEDYTGREAEGYLIGWIADCISQVNTNKFRK